MNKFYCPHSTLVKNAQNRPAKACRYARKVRAPTFFILFLHIEYIFKTGRCRCTALYSFKWPG